MTERFVTTLARTAILAVLLAAGGTVSAQERGLLAAPGVVEPLGEEREVASEVIGRIDKVLVAENEAVREGQVIVVIGQAQFEANLALARANLALRRAELTRLVNGARAEERREQEAIVRQNEADRVFLRSELERQDPLAQKGFSSRSRLDQARSLYAAADARLRASQERLALLEAPARHDEVMAAEARVAAAAADVAMAEAMLDKTLIRSPVNGTVLRLERKAGEVVSNQPPTLIAVIGDISRLRVRAEVDELDVGRIVVGQQVRVTANAYPGKRFMGKVVQVNQRMGRKQVFTGRASERLDNRALQVLVELEEGVRLPVGLTMDVFVIEPPGR